MFNLFRKSKEKKPNKTSGSFSKLVSNPPPKKLQEAKRQEYITSSPQRHSPPTTDAIAAKLDANADCECECASVQGACASQLKLDDSDDYISRKRIILESPPPFALSTAAAATRVTSSSQAEICCEADESSPIISGDNDGYRESATSSSSRSKLDADQQRATCNNDCRDNLQWCSDPPAASIAADQYRSNSRDSYGTIASEDVQFRNRPQKKKSKTEKYRQSWLLLSLSNSSSVPKRVSTSSVAPQSVNVRKSLSATLPASTSATKCSSSEKFSIDFTESKAKSKFNPIEKGRELFNDILMAKGRHRNRHNQQHQNHRSRSNSTSEGGSKGQVSNNAEPDHQKAKPVQSDFQKHPEAAQEEILPHSNENQQNSPQNQKSNEVVADHERELEDTERQSKVLSPSRDTLIFDPPSNDNTHQLTMANNRNRDFEESHQKDDCHDEKVADSGEDGAKANVCEESGLAPTLGQQCAEAADNQNYLENHASLQEISENIEVVEKRIGLSSVDSLIDDTSNRGWAQPVEHQLISVVRESGNQDPTIEEKSESITAESCSTNIYDGVVSSPTPQVNTAGEHEHENCGNNQSETTECDRDQSSETETFAFNNKMGQTNTKPTTKPSNPTTETETAAISKEPSKLPPIVVPEIRVVDFSGGSAEDRRSPAEKEVFYDFETEPPVNLPNNPWSISIEAAGDDCKNEGDDAGDGLREECDEISEDSQNTNWHFIETHHGQDIERDPSQQNGPRAGSLVKSENTSESNLSITSPDSGIGESTASTKVLLIDSCDLLNDSEGGAHPCSRSPFVRDGNSTDCEENLWQCDDLEFMATTRAPNGGVLNDLIAEEEPSVPDDAGGDAALNNNNRHILLESISLPDVVVETTSTTSGLGSQADDTQILNINGASGNVMGNVYFIPIDIEGGYKRNMDESIGNGHTSAQHNITIIPEEEEEEEEDDEEQIEESSAAKKTSDIVNQDSQYITQLENKQQNVDELQTKIAELQAKIDSLETELATKSWNVDKLQGELEAAHKDDTFIRKKLKIVEEEKTILRQNYFENEESLKSRYEELENQYKELKEKCSEANHLACSLQTQLTAAQHDAEECRQQTASLREEMEEQVRVLQSSLDNSIAERKILEDRWQNEFEMLRTQNADREDHLMTDCEWQLRQMQKACKEKIDKAQHLEKEATIRAERIQTDAEEKINEVAHLRSYQAEAKCLRGLVTEQETSIAMLTEQIEELKTDLLAANEKLEEQIDCVRQIKYKCDNVIYDKDREIIKRIDEVRNEAAALWEDKLYTEMTRLKHELESVYIEERHEALDRLQMEHIEELKALTSRYTANEEELRAELEELKEQLNHRNEEFMELREKSDTAILQTRMHLDRADREYQVAMCREEQKRETLTESLHLEFETEKQEMEEKFRERLNQVKDEFAKELQMSTQEMLDKHRRQLEQQWEKLTAEKEEAVQDLEIRYRKKLDNAENRIRDIDLRHQRDLKDLKTMYDEEKASLDKRDMNNANEIESLHRKCRCLTNLFEEMRMRYERREPRPEDLREIAELRTRCESQERDLYLLTDRLREMQIQMEELTKNQIADIIQSDGKPNKKPQPKTIPTNCDVIYEENEERESSTSSPTSSSSSSASTSPAPPDEVSISHKDSTDTMDKGRHLIVTSIKRNPMSIES